MSRSDATHRKHGVHLTGRDLGVMERLVVRRAETLGWLHAEYFPGLSRKRALNRLGDLAAAGYLKRVTVTIPGAPRPESAYTLGTKGKTALQLRSLSGEHFRHRRFNPILRDSSIPHQIVVNRVADWLGADLIPEHLLPITTKEGWRHKPDGIYMALEPNGDRPMVWLEVDLGHYSRSRIQGKAAAFRADRDAGHMLIVTHTQARANQIAQWLNIDGRGRTPISIQSFSELLEHPELARPALPLQPSATHDPYEDVARINGQRVPDLPSRPPWDPEEDE